MEGPDSGYSWVIVMSCAYIHFALFGVFRSAGVMYVALLQTYDVTREEASWPFALAAAVFQLVGPFASALTHFISLRQACLLGSAIATIGMASCYFADSVLWITMFYGVVHGIGFGCIVTLVPVTLNQYFLKYRATALGIAFSGGTISSLVFPVVMEWLLESFTLKESFLLLSGVVMNTLVASALLRAPPWIKHPKSKLLEVKSEAKDSGVSTSGELSPAKDIPPICKVSGEKSEDIRKNCCKTDQRLYEIRAQSESRQDQLRTSAEENSSDVKNCDTFCSNNDSVLFEESDNKMNDSNRSSKFRNSSNKDHSEAKEPLMRGKEICIVPRKSILKCDEIPKSKNRLRHIRFCVVDILRQPIFHLITFTLTIYFLGAHSFFMVIVDFAKDKGIPESHGIYIISVFSVTDFFGRAGLGWVTDRNYISRKSMVALNLGVLGVLYQLYPLLDSLTGILVVAAFNGLAVGSSITLFFVLQAECLGMDKLTLVIGLTSFINGFMSLLRPGVIGLFRDVIGSYNWMFHFVGSISLVFSIAWFIESWRTREWQKADPIPEKTTYVS